MHTAGSLALQNALLPSDSTIVSKLREHGLVILGKASLTEWSMFRSDNSSHSWNAVFGQTYGAYCEKQCPGGSSGGCAVAVDLGLAWGAVGTEVGRILCCPNVVAFIFWVLRTKDHRYLLILGFSLVLGTSFFLVKKGGNR